MRKTFNFLNFLYSLYLFVCGVHSYGVGVKLDDGMGMWELVLPFLRVDLAA